MKWNESAVSKTRMSNYAQDIFESWEILWDQSNNHGVEFVARKGSKVAYVKYTPSQLEKYSESNRAREFAWKISHFDDYADFRSFAEVKNDNRLRKIVL